LEAKKGVADEDGFITVVSTTKSHTAALEADVTSRTAQGYAFDPYARLKAALNASTTSEGPAPMRTVDNFYRFQMKKKRSSELDDLKLKFEEDKLRLAELKKNKLFS
jgi:ribosomal RNA-processing protein 7